jgi:hypothetical protein
MAAAERASGSAIFTTASRSYSAAIDRCKAAKLARDIAWPFGCKTLQIEKSTDFKSGKYDG